jgi:hypothetical protein
LADCGSSRYAQRSEVAVRIDYGKIAPPYKPLLRKLPGMVRSGS